MTLHTIPMPDLGEGIAEVELVEWRVRPGDTVAEDQILCDVMTDKAAVEVPSPVAGRVLVLGGEVGQTLAVGSPLVSIETAADGEAPAAPVLEKARLPEPEAPAPVPGNESKGTGGTTKRGERASASSAPPPVASSVSNPRSPIQTAPAKLGTEDRPIASPAVRRRAWEMGVDLREVPPTGTGGRIMQADLDAFVAGRGIQARGEACAAAADSESRSTTGLGIEAAGEAGGTSVIPVIGLRRRIAQRMQEAKRHIPHFTYVEEVDVTDLEALRGRLNAAAEKSAGNGHEHLTLLPFIVRALALTLPDHPALNAHFDDQAGQIVRHAAIHLGMATQTPAGLIVPVLRHAERLDLRSAAREISRLAEAARSGRIAPGELSGSTITLTSLGPLGGIVSTPIINLPEVAIVGVNRIVERPMIREGAITPRKMMNLSSSFDHRIVDGEDAARFIQDLRQRLENPAPWTTGT